MAFLQRYEVGDPFYEDLRQEVLEEVSKICAVEKVTVIAVRLHACMHACMVLVPGQPARCFGASVVVPRVFFVSQRHPQGVVCIKVKEAEDGDMLIEVRQSVVSASVRSGRNFKCTNISGPCISAGLSFLAEWRGSGAENERPRLRRAYTRGIFL